MKENRLGRACYRHAWSFAQWYCNDCRGKAELPSITNKQYIEEFRKLAEEIRHVKVVNVEKVSSTCRFLRVTFEDGYSADFYDYALYNGHIIGTLEMDVLTGNSTFFGK